MAQAGDSNSGNWLGINVYLGKRAALLMAEAAARNERPMQASTAWELANESTLTEIGKKDSKLRYRYTWVDGRTYSKLPANWNGSYSKIQGDNIVCMIPPGSVLRDFEIYEEAAAAPPPEPLPDKASTAPTIAATPTPTDQAAQQSTADATPRLQPEKPAKPKAFSKTVQRGATFLYDNPEWRGLGVDDQIKTLSAALKTLKPVSKRTLEDIRACYRQRYSNLQKPQEPQKPQNPHGIFVRLHVRASQTQFWRA